jgi:hypothetical protein
LVLKSSRPTYAIIMLVLSSLFLCATFFPLLYSVVLPNQDIQEVISAMEGRGAPPRESEMVVKQAIDAAGPLRRVVEVGYYSGVTKAIHLDGSQASETIHASQATYIAWFQKHPGPILVSIACYKNGEDQKTYEISSVDPLRVARAYAIPILLFGVSLLLARRKKSPTAF